MNNKGFAITTILYGTFILFCLLLVSMLGILATYRGNLDKLINANEGGAKGTRELITLKKQTVSSADEITRRGLYCIGDTCQYYKSVIE